MFLTVNNPCLEYKDDKKKSDGYSLKDGKLTKWNENGQIWLEEYYKDGKKDT